MLMDMYRFTSDEAIVIQVTGQPTTGQSLTASLLTVLVILTVSVILTVGVILTVSGIVAAIVTSHGIVQ